MSGESWLWIILAVFLILCCVLPMLLMRRRDRGSMKGANQSKMKH